LLAGITSEDNNDVLSWALTVVTDENEKKSFVIWEGETKIDVPFEWVEEEEAVADDNDNAPISDSPDVDSESWVDDVPAWVDNLGGELTFKDVTWHMEWLLSDPVTDLDKVNYLLVGKHLWFSAYSTFDELHAFINGDLNSIPNETKKYNFNVVDFSTVKNQKVFVLPSAVTEVTDNVTQVWWSVSSVETETINNESIAKSFETAFSRITNPLLRHATSSLFVTGWVQWLQKYLLSAWFDLWPSKDDGKYGTKTNEAFQSYIEKSNTVV
jgi:hypothetical protein